MSNNLEIVMDIDTLEIFEVIDLDNEEEVVAKDTKDFTEEVKESPYDDLNRVWLCSGYYYKPSSLLLEVERDGAIHERSLKNKHGTYPYYQHARDGT
ncbi:hypothetical protein K3M68_05930 [Streptococcus dysgalactiae subsp. dysgalactiae]|nr:hypothetical protein [Streptococcus dysgalactiae subsp. dysgalactiae]MCB2841327.1 hypothetical protein [Streptococcus dysgalactiae subsp. dysgalactiae]MCB2845712.1 hypothetical protein [Streptococcus dysgalactiae subsp. dysgalactiae]